MLTAKIRNLHLLARQYLRGSIALVPFQGQFMDSWATAELSPEEEKAVEPLYDLVYMAANDPVSPEDAGHGVIGEGEFRQRLAALLE